jgi:cyclohexadienyl dehydratase
LALGPIAHAESETLRVGTSGDYAPFSWNQDGILEGLDIDMARRMAEDLGVEVRFVRFAWPDLGAEFRAGKFDMVLSGVTVRPERAVLGRYSRPYAVVGAVALVRAEDADRLNGVESLDQPGLRIVVNAGGHLERVARGRFPRASVMTTRDNASLAERVLLGKADAAITDSAEARVRLVPELRVVGPFTRDHKAILVSAGRADLAARIDEWMLARERDGWLDERRRHWLGGSAQMNAGAATREAVAALIRLRLELMPSLAAAKRSAGLPIEDPEQEARVLQRVRDIDPDSRIQAVYRSLFEMAKGVQRKSPPAQSTSTLAELRDALARIDEQLVRELRRLPPTSSVGWVDIFERNPLPAGVETAQLLRLAATLASNEKER